MVGNTAPKSSFFNDLIKAELFKDILAMASRLPNSKNGLDMVSSGFAMAGAGLGKALNMIPALKGVPILGMLGEKAGQFLGDAVVRSRYARNEYEEADMDIMP